MYVFMPVCWLWHEGVNSSSLVQSGVHVNLSVSLFLSFPLSHLLDGSPVLSQGFLSERALLQQEGLLLFYRPGMKHMRGKDRGKKVEKGEERRGRSGNDLTDSCWQQLLLLSTFNKSTHTPLSSITNTYVAPHLSCRDIIFLNWPP